MAATDSSRRQVLRKVVPASWRMTLRRLFYEEGFHPPPRRLLARYRPRRERFSRWLSREARFVWWHTTGGRGSRLERPIILVGCPRSGTTVAANIFAQHPDVSVWGEVEYLWSPATYGQWDADHHLTAAEVTPEAAARMHERFEFWRQRQGKARFLNKNPRSSVRIGYIRAIFPDAVFLHIIRDGRAVVASMLKFIERSPGFMDHPMPFCHPPNWRELLRTDRAEQMALQWEAIVRHVRAHRAELGAAYQEFKYEALCEDPRGVLKAAFRFAGLRVDEPVLSRMPETLTSQNYKWKQQLTPAQIERVTRLQAPLLKELSYPL